MVNNMDKQEILTFTDLYIKFQERCKHISVILYGYDFDFKETWYKDWSIEYDQNSMAINCYNDVDIYENGCVVDSRTLSFPIELLSADDSQIHKYAQEKYKK